MGYEGRRIEGDRMIVRDSNGAELSDGDSVTLIKDLVLKTEFVKKA